MLGELFEMIKPILIVHSRAFSHYNVARHISSVVGGVVAGYDSNIDSFGSRVVVVSSIDYIDVAYSSKFIVPSSECIYYGAIEGIPVLTPIARELLDRCRVVTPSRAVKRWAELAGVHVDYVVPHAVVKEPASREDLRVIGPVVAKCRKKYKKIIGWIGANQYRKGLDIVFRVAGLRNEYCFLVISGYGEISLEGIPENVKLVDIVYRLKSAYSLYKLVDVLLSTSRSEGFGLPVFEAIIAGKPVVAPRIPVYQEFRFLRDFLYDVVGPRYSLYKNYVWMEYYEPVIDSLLKKLDEMVEYSIDESIVREVESSLGLENYRVFKEI